MVAANDRLAGLKGKKFDQTFLKQIVDDHTAIMRLFNDESAIVVDKDLKDWVANATPTLQSYLQKAKDLQAKIGKQSAWNRRRMLGLIPKVLLDFVESRAGPDAVLRVTEHAGVPQDKHFRLDVVYDDEEWQRLLGSACDTLRLSQDQLETELAEFFGGDALRRWPAWFKMSKTARQLLERQQTIHNTLATGVRDPDARKGIEEKFRIDMLDAEIVTHYRSQNRLCTFYKALAQWVLNHYREDASIVETHCMKRGDSECQIHIRWEE